MPAYLSFNAYLKQRFGQRVQKIPLDAGLGCPNRDGTKGYGGCIYCDARGSGTGMAARNMGIREQMEQGIKWARRRYKARLFLPYFQSFSNTYAPLSVLESLYRDALDFDGVVGIAIGTRPDCVTPDVIELVRQLAGERMVWMEYGLQSADNSTLERINRGHTVEDFVKCVELTRSAGMLVCAHVIFGLPGQDRQEMLNTVSLLADLGVEGVKFHNLYILEGTRIHRMYHDAPFHLLEQQEYASLVAEAIRRLPEDTVIQRLTGDPPRGAGRAFPEWSYDKQNTIRLIEALLEAEPA